MGLRASAARSEASTAGRTAPHHAGATLARRHAVELAGAESDQVEGSVRTFLG
jgi:hypothetical protein